MKTIEIIRLLSITVLIVLFSDAVSQPSDENVKQNPTHVKQLGLAFENVTSSSFIAEALGFMAKYDAKSTWYVDGERIIRNNRLLAKLSDNGHEIGNRGMGDEYLTTLAPEEITQNVIDADKIILDLTGKSAGTFMPPYQKLNSEVQGVLNKQDLPVFIPAIIVNYKEANTCEGTTMYLQYLMSEIQNGSSILFTEQSDNLIILRHLLRMLDEKRFEVLPISELREYSTD